MKIILFFLFTLVYSGCAQTDKDSKSLKNVTLQSVAAFKVGAAIEPGLLKTNRNYLRIVKSEFNSITPENCMKMSRLSTAQGVYDWKHADSLVSFARANNKRVHGHTLVWHMGLPQWVQDFKGDAKAWDGLLKTYITTVVSHFKGKVASWDVVNEAFEDDGSFRKSIWYEHLGPDYIGKSFTYAHEADPDALLFYNDYGQEDDNAKCVAIKQLVADFKKKQIPINGLGLQFHIKVSESDEKLHDAIKQMAATGLLIHISELTINVNPVKDNDFKQNKTSLKQQMDKFARVFKEYNDNVAPEQQYGITFWNVGDKDSFLAGKCKCDYPMMFDKNYKKKDYYFKVVEALKKPN